jgi:putative transposase
MKKEYKFRIYPTVEQETLLVKHFECVHFVYDYFLKERKEKCLNKNTSYDALTKLKKDNEFAWLKEVNSQSLQASIKDLNIACNSVSNKIEFLKFKSEYDDRQSFEVPQAGRLEDGKIIIPKFQEGIKVKIHREVKVKGKMTITKTPMGKYYVSILTEQKVEDLPKTNKQVGIVDSLQRLFRKLKEYLKFQKEYLRF